MARMAATALAGSLLLPGFASAQASPPASNFYDSWYWGLNGGAMFFTAGVDQDSRVTAPSVGGEWLITRTRIALRVAVDQSFFDEATGVFDASSSGGVRQVDVSDWRRYSAEIYFLTHATGSFHPYAGVGLALNVLQHSAPQGTFTTEGQMDTVFTAVDQFSSRASAVFTAGGQWNFNKTGLYLQGSAMPTRSNFLFSRANYTFMLQAGLRYNFGSSIEK